MGPDDITDMTSSTSKVLSLPKRRSDSANWATYSERILNYITSKGYRRHVIGTARKPERLEKRNRAFHKIGSLAPLSDAELEKHEEATDLTIRRKRPSEKLFIVLSTKLPLFK